jgi:quinol monooxygenase YgiN
MMTTEVIRYKIPAEKAAAFEESYQKAESILRGSEHCMGYRLLRGHEEPENWILLLEWDSVDGHEQGFRKAPAFKEFLTLVRPFIHAIQEMKHYQGQAMRWQRQSS